MEKVQRITVLYGPAGGASSLQATELAQQTTMALEGLLWADFEAKVKTDLFPGEEPSLKFETMQGDPVDPATFPRSLGKGTSKLETVITCFDTNKGRAPGIHPLPAISTVFGWTADEHGFCRSAAKGPAQAVGGLFASFVGES